MGERQSLIGPLVIWFLVQGKRSLHRVGGARGVVGQAREAGGGEIFCRLGAGGGEAGAGLQPSWGLRAVTWGVARRLGWGCALGAEIEGQGPARYQCGTTPHDRPRKNRAPTARPMAAGKTGIGWCARAEAGGQNDGVPKKKRGCRCRAVFRDH